MAAADGNRKGGQECGIRLCNQEYMFVRADETDGIKYCTLSRAEGGGACIAKTAKTLLVGVYDKAADMSNGKKQNTGDCEKNVMNVAKVLAGAEY